MSSANEYRIIAQDCLRMAVIAEDDRDRPLWVTMAQSWIQLAEQFSRLDLASQAEYITADYSSTTFAAGDGNEDDFGAADEDRFIDAEALDEPSN
jgi:hypothetical protein